MTGILDGIDPGLARLLAGAGGVVLTLIAGTLFALLKTPRSRELVDRVTSWWIMVALIAAALALGRYGTVAFFAAVSFIALREFLSLAPTRKEDRLVILVAYLTVPLGYLLIAFDRYTIYLVAIPVYAFLAMPALMVLNGRTSGFLASVGILHWGVMITVYNLGYIALLAMTPAAEAPEAGPAGLIFLLLVATAANDVLQYAWGKSLGRRAILPTISPNKTWAGFLGGWVSTAALIALLAPLFTPLAGTGRVLTAVLLPVAGFAGDVTMSAIKRDLGVKDSSRLIPGHGGALDRLDSLTFTAPLYFHILAFFALERF